MFTGARFNSSSSQDNKRDDDGAKRMFFGGERFLEGISREANVNAFVFWNILLELGLFFSDVVELPFCGLLGLHNTLNIISQYNEQSKTIWLGLKFNCILLKLSVPS
ncbi:hypothetical protein ABZP36_015985 [Zizania latifolia]